MTFSEEFESIKAGIYNQPWTDPGRLETCLSIALEALGVVGAEDCEHDGFAHPDCAVCYPSVGREVAQAALRRMERRVKVGEDLRPGEHQTLDEPHPWEDVLSYGPDGGDLG